MLSGSGSQYANYPAARNPNHRRHTSHERGLTRRNYGIRPICPTRLGVADRPGSLNPVTQPAVSPFAPAYRLITISLVALVTVIAFEFMAISTAMPAVAQEFDAVTTYGSAFSAMLIAQLLGIVIAGVWADRRGPMPAISVGQVFFGSGATLCALATSFPMLLVGRALTGLGAGLAVVALYVVIGRVFPQSVRPRVFSWVSAAWVLPSMIGAPLSSWLTTTWTWRLVFWIVVAPTIATFIGLTRQRGAIERAGDATPTPADSPDSSAADVSAHTRAARLGVLIALAAGVLQFAATSLGASVDGYAVLAVAALVAVFVVYPRLVPRRTLLLGRGLPSVIACRFLLNAAFNGALTYVPLMLTHQRGTSLTAAGILLAFGSFGWTVGSWIQGGGRRDDTRWRYVFAGAISLTTGLVIHAAVGWFELPWGWLLLGISASGLGMGLASTTLSVLSLVMAPPEEHGKVSSALQLSDVLGSTIGIAVCSALFAILHPAYGHGPVTYAVIWAAMAAFAALAIVGGRRAAA